MPRPRRPPSAGAGSRLPGRRLPTARRRTPTPRRRSAAALGGRGLDRPRLVRRPEEHRPAALARPAGRRAAAQHQSILIGRASSSRNISPDIDLGSDTGISRRHAQLTTDGSRWWVEDLGSSNGTYVGGALDAVPTTPVAAGAKQEVRTDDRIYLGAWTRLVVRKAASGEV